MIILDCDSPVSATASLAALYGQPEAELRAFFEQFDLEQHYHDVNPMYPGDTAVRVELERHLGVSAKLPDRVCWFHLTRTLPGNDFREGVKPLPASLGHVWASILTVFAGTEHESRLREMRERGVANFHYTMKAHDPFHAGPYAMLVREVADKPEEVWSHDYLWLPELMEDICNGYEQQHGVQLHDQLTSALVPKVVKFWSGKYLDMGCVEAATFYCYLKARGSELSMNANTCYDGENTVVPPEQIIKVELPAPRPPPSSPAAVNPEDFPKLVVHVQGFSSR